MIILKYFLVLMALLGSLFYPLPSQAYNYPDKPARGTFVADHAHLLSQEQKSQLQASLQGLYDQTEIPLVVVTIPALSTYGARKQDIEKYARALFNHWGIGSATTNNGVLFLVSLNDRKMRIQMGERAMAILLITSWTSRGIKSFFRPSKLEILEKAFSKVAKD